VARDLPLDHDIGPDQATGRIVEEAVENRRGVAERRVRHDAVGRQGQRELGRVAGHDRDVRDPLELSGEPGREPRIDLDREHGRGLRGERGGEHARPRAEIDDTVVATHSRVGNEPICDEPVTEKMLTEPRRPIGRRVPGHGRP
jgi:hypothetical protein